MAWAVTATWDFSCEGQPNFFGGIKSNAIGGLEVSRSRKIAAVPEGIHMGDDVDWLMGVVSWPIAASTKINFGSYSTSNQINRPYDLGWYRSFHSN